MGRQTAIVATEEDERSLLAFIRSFAEIRILVRAAKTADELWVDDFAPYDRFHAQYYIWNTEFSWTPDVQPGNDCVFVRDASTAPIIEFGRTDTEWLFRPGNALLVAGSRIYWSRLHMTKRPAYDLDKFDKWYDRVVRWVRKHGEREPAIAGAPYLLPDARRRWQKRGGVAEPEVAPDCGGIT